MSGPGGRGWHSLRRAFYARDSRVVAPELLNKLMVRGSRVGRIVEVEAYAGEEDPASHAWRGPTRRNATMFGPPGHMYVYRSYGIHWCTNLVCGARGTASAVLIRAVEPVGGMAAMRRARHPIRVAEQLCSGPGRLTQALGITGRHDGADVVTGAQGIWVGTDGREPPPVPGRGIRVGISRAQDEPWRWWVPANPFVSRSR